MKHQFLKSALILGSILAVMNCSEDATNAVNTDSGIGTQPTDSLPPEDGNGTTSANDSCYLFNAGQDLLIYPVIGIVTDVAGNVIGSFEQDTIKNANGTPIAVDVNLSNLPKTTRQAVNAQNPASSAATNNQTQTPTSSATTQTNTSSESSSLPGVSSSATVQNPTSSNTVSQNSSESKQTESSSSQEQQQQQPNSSSATSSNQCDGKCLDKASGECVKPNTPLKGPHDEQYAYDESCKLNCYYDPTNKNCQDMTGGSTPASSNSQQQAKSSSSEQQQQKSSSSQQQQQAKSSSSQSSANASAEEAQYINAGAGGQHGYASRYWDCCMPHCAQPAHGGTARTCSANGGKTKIDNNSTKNVCKEGGQGAACTSQTPIIVSDKLAYAFAATPGNDNTCGKCFALTFTGQGKYETTANHQALKGKTLVVMASNIGYDVQGGQFDVMIPGGGVGLYNGCSGMGWGSQGKTYGGLLSDCEDEIGYGNDKIDFLTTRKNCLTEKCEKTFANDTEAKEGCLFLATWMEAAGNPLHTYKEVPCPEALKQRY